jgi:flagellum-specific peptidoglycan hydrolase FlgJ
METLAAVALTAALARPAFAERTDQFIARMAPLARTVSLETGVPASVIIAVAALESGWGKSGLAKKCHNYFGIKGKGPEGTYRSATREYDGGRPYTIRAGFRCYDSPLQAMRDYAAVLNAPRYKKAWAHKDDPHAFIREVHKAGYATAPNYARVVSSIIKRWDLTQYDSPAGTVAATGGASPTASAGGSRRGMTDVLGGGVGR